MLKKEGKNCLFGENKYMNVMPLQKVKIKFVAIDKDV